MATSGSAWAPGEAGTTDLRYVGKEISKTGREAPPPDHVFALETSWNDSESRAGIRAGPSF
jgi:hypothetical protein